MDWEEARWSVIIISILMLTSVIIAEKNRTRTEQWIPQIIHSGSDELVAGFYFGNPQERLNATDRLIQKGDKRPILKLHRSRHLNDLNRLMEARQEIKDYLKMEPNDRQALIWLAQIERQIR